MKLFSKTFGVILFLLFFLLFLQITILEASIAVFLRFQIRFFFVLAVIVSISACTSKLDVPDLLENQAVDGISKSKKIEFPIEVTREGESIPSAAIAGRRNNSPKTKSETESGVDASDNMATMNPEIPFGIIGIDMEVQTLLVDNKCVFGSGNGYSGLFDGGLWEIPNAITFSAYYPYVHDVTYENGYQSYSIPYSIEETEAGPLVSKTVERAVDQLNLVPLQFQHITNDLGFKICDVTEDPQLQGLIHLRKVTATNVASAGVFVNDITLNQGLWHRQGYYRNEVVFEGDAVVGVGMENEKFIGDAELVDHLVDSHRYYSIPDEILMGKQCVEVVYDVDSFTIGGYTYDPLPDQVARFMLYGVLPDNVFVYGKQYTFHLGLDTGKLYQQITFQASVSDWETKIYENNDDF